MFSMVRYKQTPKWLFMSTESYHPLLYSDDVIELRVSSAKGVYFAGSSSERQKRKVHKMWAGYRKVPDTKLRRLLGFGPLVNWFNPTPAFSAMMLPQTRTANYVFNWICYCRIFDVFEWLYFYHFERCHARTPGTVSWCTSGDPCLTIFRLARLRRLAHWWGTWPSVLPGEWILSWSLIGGCRVLSCRLRRLRLCTHRQSSLQLRWWYCFCILPGNVVNTCSL